MKQAEVKVGAEYLTMVGDRLQRVKVLRAEDWHHGRSGEYRTRFRVQTTDGRVLPKARTAAALRPLPAREEGPSDEEIAGFDLWPSSEGGAP